MPWLSHPRCDRALALRLFWDLDDSARGFHADEKPGPRLVVCTLRRADEAERVYDYCRTLVDGLREDQFPFGRNTFDTAYLNLTERQRNLRAE